MGREIKFRAWEMFGQGKWVYGFVSSNWEDWFISDAGGSATLVDMESIGQFTGLEDAIGQEIYVGDILETAYQFKDKQQVRRMKVEVDTVNPCMVLVNVRNKNDVEYDFVQCGLMSLTVIGNVYENPELLL